MDKGTKANVDGVFAVVGKVAVGVVVVAVAAYLWMFGGAAVMQFVYDHFVK